MYGASNSLSENLHAHEMQSPQAKYTSFLALIQRARHYSKGLTLWEMHKLASLLPDWMHHLSYQQVESALESFTHGKFIAFIQHSYKEAFGEICRQAYLHGMLYHLLQNVSIDDETAQVIKNEVKAEVLEAARPNFTFFNFVKKFFKGKSELALHLDREPESKNTQVVDTIVADAVVEIACKKMSHPVEDLRSHKKIYQLAKRAIIQCLQNASTAKKLKLSIPESLGHAQGQDKGLASEVNFVYDMASFILSNK